MSNIVDDLLQEVEQLETSTQKLNEDVLATSEASPSDRTQNPGVDASLIALEAAKTAQEASNQSHLAAKTSIKMAEQLKAQTMELDDLALNWRQSIRNTTKGLNATKGSFSIIMGGTIAINLIALSAMGYFYYLTNKESVQFKNEILDIIQTENTLFTKKITLKVDELSTLIEGLSADIQTLNNHQKTAVNIHQVQPNQAVDAHLSQKPLIDPATKTTVHHEPPAEQITKTHDEPTQSVTPTQPKHHSAKNPPAEEPHDKGHDKTHAHPLHKEPPEQHPKKHQQDTASLHPATPPATKHKNAELAALTGLQTELQTEYASLKALVEKILAEQQKLQANTLATSHTVQLNPKQLKKLNGLSWLVRKQGKTLQSIQTSLSSKKLGQDTLPVLSTIKDELRALNQQQAHMQQQVKSLQSELTKFTQKPKVNPYSYKAKE